MSIKNSAGVKFSDRAELIIEEDGSGAVTSCFNKINNTEYVKAPNMTLLDEGDFTIESNTTASLGAIIPASTDAAAAGMYFVEIRRADDSYGVYGTDVIYNRLTAGAAGQVCGQIWYTKLNESSDITMQTGSRETAVGAVVLYSLSGTGSNTLKGVYNSSNGDLKGDYHFKRYKFTDPPFDVLHN